MDEEQKSNIDPIAEILQRPKQKINVDSFFNRSADAESITAISLKLASVIEQIDVMRTEIKDIATYITVEHKIEKDLREDRLFEEQDAKQKKEMKDRVLAKGEQVPKTAKGEAPQEESKGGGFFSGLMKIVGGLGLVAGLAALAPIILKVMGGLLITTVAVAIAKPLFNWVKGTFDKFKNFLDKTFKPVEKIPVVGKPLKNVLVGGLLGGLPGIAIAAATSISNALQGAGKGNDGGGGGGTSGPTSGGNMNLEENNAGKDMADTLENKGVIKDTRNFGDNYKEQEEYFASDEYKQSFDKEVEEVDDKEDEKKFRVTKTKRSGSKEEKKKFFENMIESGEKDLLTETNERKIQFAEKKIHKGKIGLRDMGDKRYEFYQTNVSQEERIEASKKIIESGAITPGKRTESFTIEKTTVEPIDNQLSSMNMNNTSVVVPKNEPQVSSAEIKVTGTTLAYARALQNPYLSITNKKIPPELSRIG
tara:strand:+ start:84 stop:1517 length:1434 start_codon:yes stop_codon:yes gene_type:complete